MYSTFLGSGSHSTELPNLRELWSFAALGSVANRSEVPETKEPLLQLKSKAGTVLLGTVPFHLWDLHHH